MVPREYPLPDARASLEELERRVRQFGCWKRIRYSVLAENLNAGLSVSLGGGDRFSAMGLMQVPVALYAFVQASNGLLDLSDRCNYLPQDRTGGGLIQQSSFGSSFTVRQLCEYSIARRDPVALRMLLRLLGENKVAVWIRSIGGRGIGPGCTTATPADLAACLRLLPDFAEAKPGYGGVLLEWLKESGLEAFSAGQLGVGARMAGVCSASPAVACESGLVFQKGETYLHTLVADLTGGQDPREAERDLANLAFTISRHMQDMAGKFAAVRVGGVQKALRLPAGIVEDCVTIHLLDLAEALGAEVHWDPAFRSAALERGGTRVDLKIDQPILTVNGVPHQTSLAPFIFEEQFVVPLAAVAEALGARYQWDGFRCRASLTI